MKYGIRNGILLSFVFCGCMVGPRYKKPEGALPEQFAEKKGSEVIAGSDVDFNEWWKQFNDPLLNQIIQEAVSANFDLKIAVEKILQARAQYRIENSYLWPEIDVNAVATRTRNSQNFFSTSVGTLSTFQNFFMLGFDAVWELDFFGKFRHSKKAAFYEWEAMRDDAQQVLISVIGEVALNYVNIRAIQRQIELAREKIALDEQLLSLEQKLFSAGLSSEIQLQESIAMWEKERAALPTLEASCKQTIYGLAFLLGKAPEALLSAFETSAPIPLGLNKVPLGLPSDLLRRRPDIRSAERQLAAATEKIGAAIADYFPHVSLTGSTFAGGQLIGSSYGFQSSHVNNLFSHPSSTWSVGPSVLWNMIDFGRIRANVDVQKSLQRQALTKYEEAVIGSLRDVEGALVAYFEEQRRRVMIGEEVAADRRLLSLIEDQFHSGLANELEVLQAKKVWLDAEITLTSSNQSLTSDLIAIYKALGGDWECSYSP